MRRKSKKTGILLSVIAGAMTIWFFFLNHSSVGQPEIQLYLHQEGKVIKLELEEYLIGTVAAEMPASFEIEALKAQAVCARTYAVKKIISNKSYPNGADLSDDVTTCQAFVLVSKFAPANPDRDELLIKIEKAVKATRGEILLFDSQPIDALYCSTCGGSTESASAVWGSSISYLQPVKCEDCIKSPHYKQETVLSNDNLRKLVGDNSSRLKIKILSYTPSGRAYKISINGKSVDATDMRQKLGLPSTWMQFQTTAQSTVVSSRGYGHGVGLCQFGANGMAERGKDYRQILKKYYQGVTLYNLGY